jgi:hypothetical protein
MTLSRRSFLLGCGLGCVPLLGVPVRAAPALQPLAAGELWGMPYLARGAQGMAGHRRTVRRKTQARRFELA